MRHLTHYSDAGSGWRKFLTIVSLDIGPPASSHKCNISVTGIEHRQGMLVVQFN
jgi:hypothetical protein